MSSLSGFVAKTASNVRLPMKKTPITELQMMRAKGG